MHCLSHTQSLENPSISQLRRDTARLVHGKCREFISDPRRAEALGADQCTLHGLLLESEEHPWRLAVFSNQLRAVLVRATTQFPGLDTQPYWSLIDAIGFLYDSVPGRWKYCGDKDHLRYLEWSRDFAVASCASVH